MIGVKMLQSEFEVLKEDQQYGKILSNNIGKLECEERKTILDQALKYCSDNKLFQAFPWFLNEKGWVYQNLGDFENAEYYHKKAYEIFLNQNNNNGILTSINGLVADNCIERNFNGAIQWCIKGVELAEECRNYERLTSLKINMSSIYMNMDRFQQAKEVIEEIEKTAYYENRTNEVINYLNRTMCELKIDNVDTAYMYMRKAYKLSLRYSSEIKHNVLGTMASVYVKKGWYEKAEQIFNEAMSITNDKSDHLYAVEILFKWTEFDLLLHKYKNAIDKLHRIEKIKEETNIVINNKRYYYLLNETYKYLEEYKLAYKYLKKYIELEKNNLDEEKSISFLNKKKDSQIEKSYKSLYNQTEALNSIGQRITANLNKEHIIDIIASEIKNFIMVDAFFIAIYNEELDRFNYQLMLDGADRINCSELKVNENSFTAYCIDHKKEIFIGDIFKEYKKYININEEDLNDKSILTKLTQSLMFVPIIINEKVIAIISAQNYKKNAFRFEDLNTLKILATYIGIALENSKLYKEVMHCATYDSLTNIYNRRQVLEKYKSAYKSAIENNEELSLLMIDIDNFKRINDTFGHQKGDEVIKLVATIIKESIRKSDIVGRYGGEEFIVIIKNKELKFVEDIAEKIRSNVEKNHITISGGIASLQGRGISYNKLIGLADEALYIAKEDGKNKVKVLSNIMES